MSSISIVRKPVFGDFSHTAVTPKISETLSGRIMHEVTLRNQVASRLTSNQRLKFEHDADVGWTLSQKLKKQNADPRDKFGDHLIRIFESDETCNRAGVLSTLNRLFSG